MPSEVKNVFISHVHEDDAGLEKLKGLLASNGLIVRDSSINSSNPNNATNHDYIKSSILAPQINWASTLLVYVSHKTKDSQWVNWEIEYAAKQGKRIVGVWEHGTKDCELPSALKEHADAMVGWHGNSIVDAIVGEKDGWENPDGGPCEIVALKPHRC
jgi:hypothetical protein